MASLRYKLLAEKIRSSGVSYLNAQEIDMVIEALRALPDTIDLVDAIRQYGIDVVDKGDAFTILKALET